MNDFDKQFKRPMSSYLQPDIKIKADNIIKYVINEENIKTAKFFEDDLAATDFIRKVIII